MFKRIALGFAFMLCLAKASQATNQYEFVVKSSPSVHDLTAGISLTQLEQAKYDLTQFAFKGTLDPQVFAWDGSREKANEIVTKILDERFLIGEPLCALSKIGVDMRSPAFDLCMVDLVRLYQEIEAEGVFYRDLKRKMDNLHQDLKGKPDYEASRINNNRIVDGFFSIVEGLVKETVMPLRLWAAPIARNRKFGSADRIKHFSKHVFEGLTDKSGVIEQTRQKVKELRQNCKLPGAVAVVVDVNNNNNK